MKISSTRGRLALLPLILVLPLSACGGGDDETGGTAPQTTVPAPPSTPASAAPSPAPSASGSAAPNSARPSAIRTLTDCLRRHGVKVPATAGPWTPPPGYDPAKAQKAFKACLQEQQRGG
jgi:hypothetical protein